MLHPGDLVQHRHGTIFGYGLLVSINGVTEEADVLWTWPGTSRRGVITVAIGWLVRWNE